MSNIATGFIRILLILLLSMKPLIALTCITHDSWFPTLFPKQTTETFLIELSAEKRAELNDQYGLDLNSNLQLIKTIHRPYQYALLIKPDNPECGMTLALITDSHKRIEKIRLLAHQLTAADRKRLDPYLRYLKGKTPEDADQLILNAQSLGDDQKALQTIFDTTGKGLKLIEYLTPYIIQEPVNQTKKRKR